MTGWLLGLGIGLLAGAHIATWGMYKDAPHEGFGWGKYLRAVGIATVLAAVAGPLTGLDPARVGDAVVFFGGIYALERAAEELYKTFLREEDQSKYTIPMQFHVMGRVVESRAARWAAGAVAVALVLLLLGAARLVQQRNSDPSLLAVLAIGGSIGWFSAVGGALKDAPIEGFDILKFFRSPLLAMGFALLLSRLTGNLVLIAGAAVGYTIATTETYKTFGFPSKPRGKFAGKPVLYPEMLRRRNRFVPLFVAIWLLLIVAFATALARRG